MTFKAKKTETFTATHENGTEWKLAANCQRGAEHMNGLAANFARNYCKKYRIPGEVSLMNDVTGEVFKAVVCEYYTLKISA